MQKEPMVTSQSDLNGIAIREVIFFVTPKPTISMVIPAFNEAANLPHVLPYIPDWIDEVILVDGNSTDNTVEIARQLRPDIRIVIQTGRGKGAALRCGFAAVTNDIIIMMDADGSTDPIESVAFVHALLGGKDFAKGSRFVQGGGTSDMTPFRKWGNHALTFLVRLLFGGIHTDLCYGYSAFRTSILPVLDLDCDGFEIETLMCIRAQVAGLRMCEVASFEAARIHGVSGLRTIPDGWRVLKTILSERFNLTRADKSGVLVGSPLPAVISKSMPHKHQDVYIVGAGTHFLSGISYYTVHLADTLAAHNSVSLILMRQLLPTRFYPGRARVGALLTRIRCLPEVRLFDGVDWFWLPSMLGAVLFMLKSRPRIIIFQWWTGTVLHSYLLLAVLARLLGARIVIEFHEVLDTGEARVVGVQAYVKRFLPWLIRLAAGFVVHSEYDRALLEQHYGLQKRPVAVIALGPFDQYALADALSSGKTREAPDTCCNLLYFGVIRPYKGLEDLINAFESLAEYEVTDYWLTIVGETWEGWTLPTSLIAQSRYQARITFINHYVRDEEVGTFFNGADAVVLPYHRSSASGPLHIAMSHGLPLIVTNVGGLNEAARNYVGAIFVPPGDPQAIREALPRVAALRGQHFADPHSWQTIGQRYTEFLDSLCADPLVANANATL